MATAAVKPELVGAEREIQPVEERHRLRLTQKGQARTEPCAASRRRVRVQTRELRAALRGEVEVLAEELEEHQLQRKHLGPLLLVLAVVVYPRRRCWFVDGEEVWVSQKDASGGDAAGGDDA